MLKMIRLAPLAAVLLLAMSAVVVPLAVQAQPALAHARADGAARRDGA
jgi:hypothetical protein